MNEGDQNTIKSPYLIDPGEPPPADMDESFDEIRRGSCYRNDTDLEVGRKKVDTKDVDKDKED
ncbi:3788_t:CDS:2, partial [Racocetra fulgida]